MATVSHSMECLLLPGLVFGMLFIYPVLIDAAMLGFAEDVKQGDGAGGLGVTVL